MKTSKILAVAICFLFISTIAQTAMAEKLNAKTNKNIDIEDETISKLVTIFRYGLDGNIEPVEVKLDIKNGEDISEALDNKCEELFEKDTELQGYISNLEKNSSNLSLGYGLYRIQSKGKGFHFKTKLFVKIITKFMLLKLKLPYIRVRYKRKTIFCNYQQDPNAQTNITPIISIIGNKNSTGVTGAHSILVRNFRGYTTWLGRFAFTPLLPRSFCGISTGYILKN